MTFRGILGNERAVERLESAIRSGTLPRTLLFSGPAGSGKRSLARLCAAALLCDASSAENSPGAGGELPCGRCPSCSRVLRDLHPDVQIWDYHDESFKIEYVRALCLEAARSPLEAPLRVFILCHAQELTEQAQNALLKILEEPPAVFILLCENPQGLLPTVRSRCLHLAMEPPEEAALLPYLCRQRPDAPPRVLQAAVRAGGGYVGPALAALDAAEDPSQNEAAARGMAILAENDELAFWEYLQGFEKTEREALAALLDAWLGLAHAALVFQSGGEPVWEPEEALRQAAALGAPRLLRLCGLLTESRELCDRSVAAGQLLGALAARCFMEDPPSYGNAVRENVMK